MTLGMKTSKAVPSIDPENFYNSAPIAWIVSRDYSEEACYKKGCCAKFK